MIQVVLNNDQAKAVQQAGGTVELRDLQGMLLGYVSPPPTEAELSADIDDFQVEIEQGKTLFIKLVAVSEADDSAQIRARVGAWLLRVGIGASIWLNRRRFEAGAILTEAPLGATNSKAGIANTAPAGQLADLAESETFSLLVFDIGFEHGFRPLKGL